MSGPHAPERLEVGQRHQQAAVADRGDGQPVGPRDGRPDRVARGARPTHWKACGKTKPCGVRDPQVHRRVAHERAGVDDHGALGREHARRARSRASAGPASRATARRARRASAPPAISAASATLRRAPPSSAARRSRRQRGDQRLGGLAGVADDAEVDRPVRADRLLVAVDLDHAWRRSTSAPWRVVHTFSDAPKATTTSASPISRCAGRRGEPAGDPDRERVVLEQPVGDRRGRQHRAGQLAQPPQRGPGAREHRAAAADDRGPLGAREQRRDDRLRRSPGATGASSGHAGGSVSSTVGGLHVERQHQHHRAPLDHRAPHRARHVGDRRRRPVDPLGHRADGLDERVLVDPEVRAQLRGGRVGREQDQRRARLRGLGQPRDRVRQARPLVHGRDAEAPADPGVAVGHAERAGLVAGGDEPPAGGHDRVRHGQIPAAHEPEDDVAAEAMQGLADRLGDKHARNASRPLPSRGQTPVMRLPRRRARAARRARERRAGRRAE